MHVLDVGARRLPTGVSALRVRLVIEDINALQELRNRILNYDDLQDGVNKALSDPKWQICVDKSRFLELYEHHLLSLEKLTDHQEKVLCEILQEDSVHLSAPAGAGKTFVAIQRVLEVLQEDLRGYILYVAPTKELALHFLRWMIVRLTAQAPNAPDPTRLSIMQRIQQMRVLTRPYKQILVPDVQDGSIVWKDADEVDEFALVIVDESHNVFHVDADQGMLAGIMDRRPKRQLLLSDESQSSAVTESFPTIPRVRLTQVVRSTQCIVAAAAAFQLGSQSVTSIAAEGPALKVFLFEAAEAISQEDLDKEYAKRARDAIWHVVKTFPTISLNNRLALLVPDAEFLERLQPLLERGLKELLPHRSLRFTRFSDSLRRVPLCFASESEEENERKTEEEQIVLDTADVIDGLEQLVVICIGLDARIGQTSGDLRVRAQLYKGITRAQFLAIVVNRHIKNGFLEFLCNVRYSDGQLTAKEARCESPKAAAEVCKTAKQRPVKQASKPGMPYREDRRLGKPQLPQSWTESSSSYQQDSAKQENVEKLDLKGMLSPPAQLDSPVPLDSSVWDTRDIKVSPSGAKPLYDPLAEDGLAVCAKATVPSRSNC